jgi:hypothetical protein
MEVITVVFAGLITLVLTDSGAQRAVLVAAPAHDARLTVETADVIENRGFERDSSGRYKLEGERVTIEGIPAGEALFEASFLRNVPSLARISHATAVLPEIETASPHPAVAAYLDLGRGTFSATDVDPRRYAFGEAGTQCIARTVTFLAETADTVTFRTASGKSLRVRGGTTVRISNVPRAGTMTPHFHMYSLVLADGIGVAEPLATAESCGGRRRASGHEVHAMVPVDACSVTKWP